jgi:prevent-host-death family protein
VTVGIRELKNKLSHYLDKVRAGERIAVTDRGTIVAYVIPVPGSPGIEGLLKLVREDRAAWEGGKPAGATSLASVRGKAVSEIVVEDRR